MGLSLRGQGLLVISALLVLELLFVGCFIVLLQQAEVNSKMQQRTREAMDRGSRLLQDLYTAGDRVGKYAHHESKTDLREYRDAKKRCEETVSWLEANLEDQPEQMKRVEVIKENINIGFTVLEKMKTAAGSANASETTRFGIDQRVRLQPHIEELVDSLRDFMSVERAIEENGPEVRRQTRTATIALLAGAGCLNILLAFGIGWLFSRSITSRLQTVIDNSLLLEEGLPLNLPMDGDDEISRLDSTFHEMTSQLRGQEALLKASEHTVLSLISQMPAGVMMIEPNGRIELSNEPIGKMLGYTAVEIADMRLTQLMVSKTDSDSELITAVLQASPSHFEVDARKSDGGTIPVELAISTFSDAGEGEDRYIATIMDVSAKQEMQRLRKAFVAMVSHELRTPLTHVSGFLDLLKMGVYGPITGLAESEMESSIDRTQQLSNLVNDLLDMEKLDAGMFDIVKAECELEDVVDDAVDSVSSMVERSSSDVLFEGCEVSIVADRECLAQSLSRLLSAALQLSPGEGEIRVSALDRGAEIEVVVEMPEVRIPDDQIPAMFDRFQQVDSPFKQNGVGLGLALSRAIIEQHEGVVGVRSNGQQDDRGTEFFMRLPKKA